MRARFAAGLAFALACACRGSPSSPVPEAFAKIPAPEGSRARFAVVELFTSEGCSSCPPADDVLAGLEAGGGSPVYPLAFHVDYWDDLGWRDPFAAPAFTERQRSYARSFGTGRLYTPQMIVNGTEELVGSDGDRARTLLAQALSRPGTVRVSLSATRAGPGRATVDYAAEGQTEGASLQIAVVSGRVAVRVKAGENAGRTLSHTHVVRSMETISLDPPSGSRSVDVPADMPPTGAEIVAFVQAAGDVGMPIRGAARLPLPR